MITIKITDIFMTDEALCNYSKSELAELELKKDFINKMNQQLGLIYVKGSQKEGNLCYQNAPELQPAYKMTFSKSDVINYLSAALNVDKFSPKKDEVLFPKNCATFWKSGQ